MSINRAGIDMDTTEGKLVAESVARLIHMAMASPTARADIFVSWKPHVNWIDFEIHPEGWSGQPDPLNLTLELPGEGSFTNLADFTKQAGIVEAAIRGAVQ